MSAAWIQKNLGNFLTTLVIGVVLGWITWMSAQLISLGQWRSSVDSLNFDLKSAVAFRKELVEEVVQEMNSRDKAILVRLERIEWLLDNPK